MEKKIPDLIIIDGGKDILTQSKKFRKFKINDLDIIAISKGINRNKWNETIHTNEKSINFDKRSQNLFFFKD